jgi:hypothetical protein
MKIFFKKAVTRRQLSNISIFKTFRRFATMSKFDLPEHLVGNDKSVW